LFKSVGVAVLYVW